MKSKIRKRYKELASEKIQHRKDMDKLKEEVKELEDKIHECSVKQSELLKVMDLIEY